MLPEVDIAGAIVPAHPAGRRGDEVKTMLKPITRSRAIQIWFAAVALVVVAGFSFGGAVTLGTGALLAALCLVPPAMILLLWPGIDHPTVAEVLHDTERRG